MTEIAVPTENTAVAEAAVPTGLAQAAETALLVWATEARQAGLIAQSLANTSFVPSTMRGKTGDITGAILAGHELGLSPMAALRSIDIIQGTPGLRAHAMRGLVQSHGHEVEVTEASETKVVMRGRRRRSTRWQTVTWTIERAAKLGLTGKSEWKKQPQTMLIARATGEICRLIAADVLHAMPYASEELDGFTSVPERAASSTAKAEPPAVPGEVTLAELTGADAEAREDTLLGADGPDDEDDEPETAAYDEDVAEWPEVVTPGSGGAR